MQYINKEKLEKIKFTKSNFYVAVDFDRTITDAKSLGSWDIGQKSLGEDCKKELDKLWKKYGPIETDYHISFEEKNKAMEEWYYQTLQLYYKYHLTFEKLLQAVESGDIIFREGAKEFLDCMQQNRIPVIILSAGLGNVIVEFLKQKNCYYDNIYIIGNFIPFNKKGEIEEYKGELIHTLNKTMEGHITQQLAERIAGKEYRLLLGDFVEDKKMVPEKEWNETITIRFLR